MEYSLLKLVLENLYEEEPHSDHDRQQKIKIKVELC